jgi:hypothetical protein
MAEPLLFFSRPEQGTRHKVTAWSNGTAQQRFLIQVQRKSCKTCNWILWQLKELVLPIRKTGTVVTSKHTALNTNWGSRREVVLLSFTESPAWAAYCPTAFGFRHEQPRISREFWNDNRKSLVWNKKIWQGKITIFFLLLRFDARVYVKVNFVHFLWHFIWKSYS